jgi:hypothetical protein
MKLATFGKILRGVGQGAAVVGSFTPAGAAITTGLKVTGAVTQKLTGGKQGPNSENSEALFPSSPAAGIDLDGDGECSLREIAAFHVLGKFDSCIALYLDEGRNGTLNFHREGISEYLEMITDEVEAWLRLEQKNAIRTSNPDQLPPPGTGPVTTPFTSDGNSLHPASSDPHNL